MPFNFNPATLNALARLVQVFDRHRFGAIMLIVFTTLLVIACGLAAVS